MNKDHEISKPKVDEVFTQSREKPSIAIPTGHDEVNAPKQTHIREPIFRRYDHIHLFSLLSIYM